MLVIASVVIGGVFAAAVAAVLWTLLFTFAFPWPGHSLFTPLMFLVGGAVGALMGLQRAIR